ncbi:MAG TPA: hypothetical protein DEF34_03120 [Desulfotomaculum sp.]|nr:MAG: hypothetical protein JL56_02740 [Desulfotomaculum sp. BICA1-6]HBX22618.1 hypothetical protein [Desulfotomaculum sp.]
MISSEEREYIYQQEKYTLGETLVWQTISGSDRIIAPVFLESGEELTLRATKSPRRFSFALHYRRNQLIRRWDCKRHTNPDGTVFADGTPHKHYWTPEYGDDFAYEVDDIPLDNFNHALMAFLKECNIRIEGNFQLVLF